MSNTYSVPGEDEAAVEVDGEVDVEVAVEAFKLKARRGS